MLASTYLLTEKALFHLKQDSIIIFLLQKKENDENDCAKVNRLGHGTATNVTGRPRLKTDKSQPSVPLCQLNETAWPALGWLYVLRTADLLVVLNSVRW